MTRKPSRRARGVAGAMLVAIAMTGTRLWAQGFSPADAVRRMTAADGFDVRLVASEPLMAQPVCVEFDDRGRLWVVQYLQYPNPAGLKRVKVDRYSRTVYDRVPEPPPRGPRGADRVTILEDRDKDGVADAAHDFVNGLNLATSIAFGYGGIFVMQAPYLLFYADRDNDDVPDGEPEVLLSGFGIEDAQSFANSLIIGPDGWLYGCQGSTVTAHVKGIEFQQAIWRYHPPSRRFELFSEGGGNMWGLDYDQDGELFASTNGGGGIPSWSIDAAPPFPGRFVNFRVIHMVQGGYYAKSFAKHGELHNPHAYGYFERVPAPDYRGFHVTPGAIVYQGDTFPPELRGRIVTNDLLEHTVQWSALDRWGTTFKGHFDGYLLKANDTWFAPSDSIPGPDGAVYTADWSDQRMSHPDPDAEWDRSNGRIYRLQWGAAADTPAAKRFDTVVHARSLQDLTSEALVALLAHPNNWYVRKARRILSERRDPAAYTSLRSLAARNDDSQLALEAFWALYGSGGADEAYLCAQLQHASPRIRRWAVRLLGDADHIAAPTDDALISVAKVETDATVRRQLASTAARLPTRTALSIAHAIALQDRDAADPFIPLLLWWAIERHALDAVDDVARGYSTPAAWNSSVARQSLIPRIARRFAAEGSARTLEACAALLGGAPLGSADSILSALEQGLRQSANSGGRPTLEGMPAALSRRLMARWQDTTIDVPMIRLFAWLGHEPAHVRAATLAGDRTIPDDERVTLIRAMADPPRPNDASRLFGWLGENREKIQAAALEALLQFRNPDILARLLDEYRTLSPALRAKMRTGVLSRPDSARVLLERVDRGQLAAADFAQSEVRAVAQFGDAQLDALVRRHWGKVHATPEDKLAVVRRFNNDLSTVRDKPPGVAERGHVLYQQLCATCHRLHGEGAAIGPDLTTANRRDKDFLLTSLVDPSAVIRREYLNYTVRTKDGRTLNGFVAEASDGAISITTAAGESTRVTRDQVSAMEDSGVSLMPEGLLDALTPQQLRDLFAYLQADAGRK